MNTRVFGGAAVLLGAAGVLHAQQPQYARPAVSQKAGPVIRLAKTSAEQAPAAAPAVAAKPAVLAGTPTVPAAGTPAMTLAPHTPGTQLLATGTSCPTYASCDTCPTTGCCEPCGPAGKFWIDAGYIFWTTSGQRVPPLVTTAPVGTPRNVAGALGQPTTSILYPNGRLNDDWRSGFYLNAGMWLDDCQKCGIEGNFFFLGDSTNNYSVGSDGSRILTRPFFNTQRNAQDTQLVSFPGDTQLVSFPNVLAGSVAVSSKNSVIGGGPNFIKNLCCGPCGRLDLLLGYSYLNVSDEIVIRENLTSLPGATNVANGTRFLVEDRFKTSNNFHGGNVGFAYERRFSHWYFGLRAGVGLGVNRQVIDINGQTVITPPGGSPTTYAGGLLTQPSNIGRYTRDQFAVLPWVGARVGCQLTERARVYVGYDFMALTNVVRAGDQIDLRVNPTQIPPRTNGTTGPLFPRFEPKESTFWAQGVRFGVEFRF